MMLPDSKFVIATTMTSVEERIRVPLILEVKQGIMAWMHNHPTAGHPG